MTYSVNNKNSWTDCFGLHPEQEEIVGKAPVKKLNHVIKESYNPIKATASASKKIKDLNSPKSKILEPSFRNGMKARHMISSVPLIGQGVLAIVDSAATAARYASQEIKKFQDRPGEEVERSESEEVDLNALEAE